MFKLLLACCALLLLISGCSAGSDDALTDLRAEPSVAAAVPDAALKVSGASLALASTPASPTAGANGDHNYDFHEGDAYGYVAAVPADDQQNGKVVGDVLIYRYAGLHDGMYELVLLGTSGAVLGMAECRSPCRTINESFTDGRTRTVEYERNTVLGAAFQDAIAGKLITMRSARAPSPIVTRL